MENKKQQKISLARLSKHFGYNRKSIADALGVELITVYSWFKRGRISKEAAIRAEIETNGEITAAQLRPDVPDFFGG